MDHSKFEYVLAIAKEKNMTQAAKKLYISQPALTVTINKLEERFYISDDHIRRRHGIFIPRQNKYENTEGFPGIRGGRHDCRFRMVPSHSCH